MGVELTMSLPITMNEASVRDFCRRHHIRRLSLFGSVLRDDFRPESDVDVLVEFAPDYSPGLASFEMEAELEGILGRRVDFLTAGFLGSAIRGQVLEEALPIYVES